ncbi:hypothetical protein CHS0354_026145 [Potamilus streckersoni]|uniref:Uncharacterized protein n=1 Tax=Potamilus streckersoni TaxID=2493646 RepID=A0AAE0S1F7_9BIVA|nr:hypothetical protein CHS0354_026145 [Potamilus streckersoni]
MSKFDVKECWKEWCVAFACGIIVGAIVSAIIAACLYRSKKSNYTGIVRNSQENQYNARVTENSSGSRPLSVQYWSIHEINGITTSCREDSSRNRGFTRNSPSSSEEFPPPPPELLVNEETLTDTEPVDDHTSDILTPTNAYENSTVFNLADRSDYKNVKHCVSRMTAAKLEKNALPQKYVCHCFSRPQLPRTAGFKTCGYNTGYVNRS